LLNSATWAGVVIMFNSLKVRWTLLPDGVALLRELCGAQTNC